MLNRMPMDAHFAELTPHDVATRGTAFRIIDVREPSEWGGELGHIQGAELVPLSTLAQAAASWDRATPLVMVCRSGGRSGRATSQLVQMGFKEVHNMNGGMLRWSSEARPVTR